MNTLTKRRLKPRIQEMYPVKKYLSESEACAYMDLSQNNFLKRVAIHISTYSIGAKKYYAVSDLNNFFQGQVLIKKQTA